MLAGVTGATAPVTEADAVTDEDGPTGASAVPPSPQLANEPERPSTSQDERTQGEEKLRRMSGSLPRSGAAENRGHCERQRTSAVPRLGCEIVDVSSTVGGFLKDWQRLAPRQDAQGFVSALALARHRGGSEPHQTCNGGAQPKQKAPRTNPAVQLTRSLT